MSKKEELAFKIWKLRQIAFPTEEMFEEAVSEERWELTSSPFVHPDDIEGLIQDFKKDWEERHARYRSQLNAATDEWKQMLGVKAQTANKILDHYDPNLGLSYAIHAVSGLSSRP